MNLNFPDFKNLFDIFASKLKEKKPEIDPTVDGSFAFSFGKGVASVGYALVIFIKQLLKQFFAQTATGQFLALFGSYNDLLRLDPSSSLGNIAVTGIDTTIIAAEESWQGSNGIFYTNSIAATIEDNSIVLINLTSEPGIATATSSGAHNLATGMSIIMAGADQTEYNGTVTIAVTADNQFTYPVTGSPVSPATGSFEGNATFASVSVQSTTNGSITKLSSGSVLNYQGVIGGVDATGITDFFGLQGGAGQEDQEAFRARILLSRSAQEGVFTNTQIILAAKLINGNTRVFIQNPNTDDLSDPDPILPGQVKIFILRDDDDPITPGATILTLTKRSIIENGKLPANQLEDDIFVLSPELLSINFTFTELTPDSGTMRLAIEDQLNAFFTDESILGTDIDEDVLRGVIVQTQDLVSGDFIQSFDFTTIPLVVSGLIPVASDELPVLGTVSF